MGTEDQRIAGSLSSSVDAASSVGLPARIEDRYRKLKEHAETYPYVWASYILVYGGFGIWTAYRWRKLRKTEARVRTLQERLRKLVEAEDLAASSSTTTEGKPSAPPGSEPPASRLPK